MLPSAATLTQNKISEDNLIFLPTMLGALPRFMNY